MTTLAWHLMLRLTDRRVLAPSVVARRGLARVVHAVAGVHGLLAFRGSDTHLHVLLACDRAEAGRVSRNLGVRLHWELGLAAPFDDTLFQPVEDQQHLANAASYVLHQDVRHGFGSDPLHDASLLPDLLELRVLGPEAVRRFREHLPRLGRPALLALLGVPALEPGDDPAHLVDAAAAALALPGLANRRPTTVLARTALAHAAVEMGHGARVGEVLDVDRKTAWRLRSGAAPAALVRAVRLQVGLREALATARGAQVATPGSAVGSCAPESARNGA
jgi:hypothetical protein